MIMAKLKNKQTNKQTPQQTNKQNKTNILQNWKMGRSHL